MELRDMKGTVWQLTYVVQLPSTDPLILQSSAYCISSTLCTPRLFQLMSECGHSYRIYPCCPSIFHNIKKGEYCLEQPVMKYDVIGREIINWRFLEYKMILIIDWMGLFKEG